MIHENKIERNEKGEWVETTLLQVDVQDCPEWLKGRVQTKQMIKSPTGQWQQMELTKETHTSSEKIFHTKVAQQKRLLKLEKQQEFIEELAKKGVFDIDKHEFFNVMGILSTLLQENSNRTLSEAKDLILSQNEKEIDLLKKWLDTNQDIYRNIELILKEEKEKQSEKR